jgi:N-acylglucosamine-6-phosphate 2-epimerase
VAASKSDGRRGDQESDDFDWFSGGIVVSCQAREGSPLRDPYVMSAMAAAAVEAGARGIRANGAMDISAIARRVAVPNIGIQKRRYANSDVYITATRADGDVVADAGATIVAMDCTPRRRPGNETIGQLIDHAHARALRVLADLVSSRDGALAVEFGADALATTLVPRSGGDLRVDGPNVREVEALRAQFPNLPILAEGRYATVSDLRAAFSAGATSVVVGSAVTDTLGLTRTLVSGARLVDEGRS